MGVIFIRAIMFVSDLASFEGRIFFVQNMPVMFGIFRLESDAVATCLDNIEISAVNTR